MNRPATLAKYLAEHTFTFELGYVVTIGSPHCAFHSHSHFEIVYHARGRGTTAFADGGRSMPFEEGSVFIYPPRLAHNQTTTPPGEDLCVHVSAPGPYPSPLDTFAFVPPLHDTALIADFHELTRAATDLSTLEQTARSHRASALIAGLLACLGSDRSSDEVASRQTCASKAHEFIRERFRTLERVEDVAVQAGLGYDRLRHVFHETYGMSMKEWLVSVRLARARTLLHHSGLPHKAIADLCGYRSDRYFCTDFRKYEGCTPGEFRQRRGR